MLKKINKDYKIRQNSFYKNLRLKLLKAVMYNMKIQLKYRFYCQILVTKEFTHSFTQVKNRCILSGRSRGIYSFFKLSRIRFKEYALMGNLFGVFKMAK